MFFLLRVAFWLSIVLILLPSGDYQPKTAAPSIGAADAIGAATAAVSDMSGFCQRQPDACEVGGQAAVALGQRAQAGARSVQLHVFNPKLIDRVRNDPIHSLHADESDPNPLERYS